MNNDKFIVTKVIKDFNKKYTNKGFFNKIKQYRCKNCKFVYIQGKMCACEKCKPWSGYKVIKPTKLICFCYKRRENNGK